MKRGYAVAFVVLLVSAAFTLFSFSGAVAKHVSIADAKTSAGRIVQVPGRILPDTVQFRFDGGQGELTFDVEDLQGTGERLTIVYSRPKPEGFENATSVEAIGRYANGRFNAHTLLVKCPSKYQGEAAS